MSRIENIFSIKAEVYIPLDMRVTHRPTQLTLEINSDSYGEAVEKLSSFIAALEDERNTIVHDIERQTRQTL